MYQGTIYFTMNFEVAQTMAFTNGRIIILDEMYEGPEIPGVMVMGSVLLPPYSALESLVDGDIKGFCASYYEFLTNYNQDSFLTLIMYCLMRDINIVLYAPPGNDVGYYDALRNYLFTYFGIVVGDEQIPFSYQNTFPTLYMPILWEKFYLYDMIDSQSYMLNSDPKYVCSLPVLDKLTAEYSPVLPNYDAETRYRYFENYKDAFKKHFAKTQKSLVIPITTRRVLE